MKRTDKILRLDVAARQRGASALDAGVERLSVVRPGYPNHAPGAVALLRCTFRLVDNLHIAVAFVAIRPMVSFTSAAFPACSSPGNTRGRCRSRSMFPGPGFAQFGHNLWICSSCCPISR